MLRGARVAVELLLIVVLVVVSIELWIARCDVEDARDAQQRLGRMCLAVHVTLHSAALAADRGDSDETRGVLALPGLFLEACTGEVVDTDKLSWCWINNDRVCAARELRVLADRIR